jgi:hypothetical protein
MLLRNHFDALEFNALEVLLTNAATPTAAVVSTSLLFAAGHALNALEFDAHKVLQTDAATTTTAVVSTPFLIAVGHTLCALAIRTHQPWHARAIIGTRATTFTRFTQEVAAFIFHSAEAALQALVDTCRIPFRLAAVGIGETDTFLACTAGTGGDIRGGNTPWVGDGSKANTIHARFPVSTLTAQTATSV